MVSPLLDSRDRPETRGATASAIGERVRQLRIARGLTQAEVARDRVTKEYVSQIERGRARPTARTLDWLAERLGVERAYLETGSSSGPRPRSTALGTTRP